MRPAMTQKQARHRTATSVAMKRLAEARQCPKCKRKGALSRSDLYSVVFYQCRWHDCDYEKHHERNLLTGEHAS